MSSIYGVNSTESTNYFSAMLGKSSSASKKEDSGADSISSLFAASSNNTIGDYALIQSGAYKKLLNAYYSKQKTSGTEENKTEKINLTTAGSDSSALSSSVSRLTSLEINNDNKEAVKEQLKDVIDKYNSVIDSASKVDNVAVLRQALWMTQGTSAVAATLTDAGISIGEGNKLSLDEAKFDKADIRFIKTLTEGSNSYFNKLYSRAELLTRASNNAVSGTSSASTYKKSGDYSSSSSGNIIDSKK